MAAAGDRSLLPISRSCSPTVLAAAAAAAAAGGLMLLPPQPKPCHRSVRGGQIQVLSVDDDPVNQMVASTALRSHKWDVVKCMSGTEVSRAQQQQQQATSAGRQLCQAGRDMVWALTLTPVCVAKASHDCALSTEMCCY